MAKISGKIRRCVMSISFQERKKRELIYYKKEVGRLQNMEADAMDLEYINLKTEYEHRKNVLSIFMLTILISVLMDVWQYFYAIVEKIIQYTASYQGNETEAMKIVFMICMMIVVFITVIIVAILILYTRRMHRIYKNLMIIAEIRNKRNR